MSLMLLLVLIVATIIAGYYGRSLPAPWPWVVVAVIVVVWLLVLISLSGIDGGLLHQRVG
jgi:hypothetical protein